jgi:hypothetical protein
MDGRCLGTGVGELMVLGWRSRIQVILALFLLLTASPLATSAQVATPVADPETPVVSGPPTAETTPESEAPAGDTGTPAETPAAGTSSRPGTVAPMVEGEAAISITLMECENNDLAGGIDFFPIQGVAIAASQTGTNCETILADAYVEMYLIDEATGDFFLIEQAELVIPAGTYSIQAAINFSEGVSAPIEFAPNSGTLLQIISYVPETGSGEIVEGTGSVAVLALECVNWERAGESDFLVQSAMLQRSASTECVIGATSARSFTLVNADDPTQILSPDDADEFTAVFSEVPSGFWYVTEATTGAQSAPIAVSDGQTSLIQMISYVEGPIDLFIEKIFCEDDTRAGTTGFALDTPPSMFGAMATSSTCFSVPPSGEIESVSVTLDNTETGDSYRVDLEGGAAYLESIEPGTYVATESVNGSSVSSDALLIVEPGKRLRIINYVPAETAQPEPGEGFGTITGLILYCSSPDRAEGDVDFIVRNQLMIQAASTSECEFGAGASGGLLVLYPANPDTGEVDEAASMQIWTDGRSFWQDIIPAGTYAMGYVSPYTGETLVSSPFTIAHRATTSVDINVFAAPAFTTYLDVWKDICVDPALAGQTSFQLITEEGGFEVAASEDGTPTDCRYSTPEDGEFTYTLTSLDTNQTWTRTVTGGEYFSFENLLAGTYTLAETHNGITATSEPFELVPSVGVWQWMNVRNFVAEKDWTEPQPGEDVAYIGIFAYGCANPGRDGGAQWFRYAPVEAGDGIVPMSVAQAAEVSTASDTSDCITVGEADGVGFIAERVGGEGEVYEFFENGPGLFELINIDGIPAGDYIITELSTGATTGVVRIVGWTAFDFLMFQELPKAQVTLNVESADPAIANTLPEGATWTVTNIDEPAFSVSGTFADRELPLTILLDEPLPYGEYLVEVNATPDFELYSEIFTVGPMELASTHLFGLLQQAPEVVTFDIVLQPAQAEPTPEPTVSPEPTTEPGVTPTATATPPATATPETEVTQLPSTGGGDLGGGSGTLVLVTAMGAIIAAAGAFALRSKRA